MLDSLPCLTSLRCHEVSVNVSDLLAIASHSTLKVLDIDSTGAVVPLYRRSAVLHCSIRFCSAAMEQR